MTAPGVRRFRLLLRDLAAAAAFASMALSGQIPAWACAAFAVGCVLALLQQRVLARVSGPSTAILGIFCLALFGQVATGRTTMGITSCIFASLVCLHRLLSEPTPSTDGQLSLVSLLMAVGGSALSGDLLFAACLLAYGIAASLSWGLSVIESSAAPGEVASLRPALRQLFLGVAATLLGGALFFAFFPRLSWNVAARRPSPGLGEPTMGFSDRVRLGGDGRLKKDPRIVLRATLDPDPGTAHLNSYWLGKTYDQFVGDEWVGRGTPQPPTPSVEVSAGGSRERRSVIRQRIDLLPTYGARTALALDRPLRIGGATVHLPSGAEPALLMKVEGEEVQFAERAQGFSYLAESADEPVPAEALEDSSRYLSLPERLDPRIPALARDVAGINPDPLHAARALERHLRTRYRYSLELSGTTDDPLADFLFARKQGHCEQFATALAVLLRTLGVPARVATGFFGGERIGRQYVLRGGDAHAWVQAFIPSKGFVNFDATPEQLRSGQTSGLLSWAIDRYETLQELWRSRVLDYSIQDQAQVLDAVSARVSRQLHFQAPSRKALARTSALAIAIGALFWVARHLAHRPDGAAVLLKGLERYLKTRSRLNDGPQRLEEACSQALERGDPAAAELLRARRRYLEARFGGRPLRVGEPQFLLKQVEAAARNTQRTSPPQQPRP